MVENNCCFCKFWKKTKPELFKWFKWSSWNNWIIYSAWTLCRSIFGSAHQKTSWTTRLKQCLWNFNNNEKGTFWKISKNQIFPRKQWILLVMSLSLRHSGSLLLLSYGMPLLEKQFDANPLFSVWKKDQQPFVCLILNYSPLNQGSVSITVFSHITYLLNPFSFAKNRFTNPKYFSSRLRRACIP